MPQLGVDDQGNLTVVWRDQTGASDELLRSRVVDAAAPVLTELSVPATVGLGTSARVSVAAADRWGIGSISWDFGDGTTATAARPTHVYSAREPSRCG